MVFTKALRKYLSERKGQIVDCAALHEGAFCVVPYKTLTKVINRFVKDGTLLLVSKGVYLAASDQTVDVDKAIERYARFDQSHWYWANDEHWSYESLYGEEVGRTALMFLSLRANPFSYVS